MLPDSYNARPVCLAGRTAEARVPRQKDTILRARPAAWQHSYARMQNKGGDGAQQLCMRSPGCG